MSKVLPRDPLTRRIRFADFEVDLRTGELLKSGDRIRLQNQPFQVLALLIERAGDLVGREELQKAIFGTGINVDFEHGVNRAINKLRNALGDSADRPQIIETLPGRGYRFIAPIAVDRSLSHASVGVSYSARDPHPQPIPVPGSGALPLHSPFYIEREADTQVRLAMDAAESVVLLKGARQTGKTSLLARVLARSRGQSELPIITDVQKLRLHEIDDLETFLRAVAISIADALGLDLDIESAWDTRRSATSNFERFLMNAIKLQDKRVVWGIDEADRVFPCPYASEFFGLLRAWHNERALNPDSLLQRLTIVIAYATEAHLFITDPNQSPFNVGRKFELLDFTEEQIGRLNERYGSPLNEAGISELKVLLGGHPHLTQQALYQLTFHRHSISDLVAAADEEDGPFSDHLRHLLLCLERHPGLLQSVRGVLAGTGTDSIDHFYRLRAFGVIAGDRARNAVPRCKLYRDFLSRHLM